MYNLERRKYKRIEMPYMAKLRIKRYEGQEISSARWDLVVLKDLSAGGALFSYGKYLKLCSLLDLKIDVSTDTPTIRCAGRVTRIEQSQPHSLLHIATEFTDIKEKEKEMINTTVEAALE
jgi:c-di-GMP-binding flagellar brake protein YcgR